MEENNMQRELIGEQNGYIVLYTTPEGNTQLEVKLENETVWLTIEQMSQLFGRERSNISRHIHNIFKEGELEESLVCAKFAHPKKYGRREGLRQKMNPSIAESRPDEKDVMVKVVVNLINQENQ